MSLYFFECLNISHKIFFKVLASKVYYLCPRLRKLTVPSSCASSRPFARFLPYFWNVFLDLYITGSFSHSVLRPDVTFSHWLHTPRSHSLSYEPVFVAVQYPFHYLKLSCLFVYKLLSISPMSNNLLEKSDLVFVTILSFPSAKSAPDTHKAFKY